MAQRGQELVAHRVTRPPKPSLVLLAQIGSIQEVKACIERHGEDVNLPDMHGTTALHIAAETGNKELASYLLSMGADAMARNADGFVPMHLAARGGNLEVVETMRGQDGFYLGDLDIRTSDGWSCLHLASREGQLDLVQLLLSAEDEEGKAVAVDGRTSDGRTALMIAAQKGREDVVRMLLAEGADVSLSCWDEEYKAMEGHASVVSRLLAGRAEVDGRAQGGWTPLMLAAAADHHQVCAVLLRAGADAGQETETGWQAAALAEAAGHVALPQLLQ